MSYQEETQLLKLRKAVESGADQAEINQLLLKLLEEIIAKGTRLDERTRVFGDEGR